MKNCSYPKKLNKAVVFLAIFISCSENPIKDDTINSSLQINTLLIEDINLQQYRVAPNLGSNQRLYLGSKNHLNVSMSFIKIPATNIGQQNYWNYAFDSTITIDSLHFILYSEDSLTFNNEKPNLYFSSDSQFDENNSHYLDFQNYTFLDWTDMRQPRINHVDSSSGAFSHTELVWDMDTSYIHILSDTLDLIDSIPSNLTRTFAVSHSIIDSTLLQFYSEEATAGERDPKIIMFFTQTIISGDSTITSNDSVDIFSDGDLSIFEPMDYNSFIEDSTVSISNGAGTRGYLTFNFPVDTLPEGALIRSASLFLSIDSSSLNEDYLIYIDPIDSDSIVNDTVNIYNIDPYNSKGYPYRLPGIGDSSGYEFSMKNILQNILMGNEKDVIGFKLVADERDDPFKSVFFRKEAINQTKLEITYVFY